MTNVCYIYQLWQSDVRQHTVITQNVIYIYFIIQFRQHNIKVKVTATYFDLTSHLQAYLRTKTNYNMPVHIWDPRWLTVCVGIRI